MKRLLFVILSSVMLFSCEKQELDYYQMNIHCYTGYHYSQEIVGPLKVVVRETYPVPDRRVDSLFTDSFGRLSITYRHDKHDEVNWSGVVTVIDPEGVFLTQQVGFDWQGTDIESEGKPYFKNYRMTKTIDIRLLKPSDLRY